MVILINIVSKKRFQILEKIIEKKEFTQYEIKKELKFGMSIVNDTVQMLIEKEFIETKNNKYFLKDEKGLLELIAFLKPTKILAIIKTSIPKKEAIKRIDAIICMETALEQYTNYYKSNRLAIYANKTQLTKIKKQFFVPGNETEIAIFEDEPKLTKKEIISDKIKYTNKIRTIIDLYRDNKAFLADKIRKVN